MQVFLASFPKGQQKMLLHAVRLLGMQSVLSLLRHACVQTFLLSLAAAQLQQADGSAATTLIPGHGPLATGYAGCRLRQIVTLQDHRKQTGVRLGAALILTWHPASLAVTLDLAT